MGRPGPRKVQCYSLEFKRAAVGLSRQPGMQVQVVATALEIHPFMLSRWRKEFREGRLKPSRRAPRPRPPKVTVVRELRRLQALEVAHRVLQEEHALLKKAIRFCSARRATSSPSSKRNEEPGR
jgi:transposase